MNPQPSLIDQAQRDAIKHDLQSTILVEAAAGTGKTTSMIDRMVNLLAEGHLKIDTLAAETQSERAALVGFAIISKHFSTLAPSKFHL